MLQPIDTAAISDCEDLHERNGSHSSPRRERRPRRSDSAPDLDAIALGGVHEASSPAPDEGRLTRKARSKHDEIRHGAVGQDAKTAQARAHAPGWSSTDRRIHQ